MLCMITPYLKHTHRGMHTHTCIHTYIEEWIYACTFMHVYTQREIDTCMHMYACICTQRNVHACTFMYAYTCAEECTCACTFRHAYTHRGMHTHAMHACIHTCTCMHTCTSSNEKRAVVCGRSWRLYPSSACCDPGKLLNPSPHWLFHEIWATSGPGIKHMLNK